MATYITVADVDAILGSDWTTEDKKARSVMQANAYLTSLNLVGVDMDDVAAQLEREGVASFATAFDELIAALEVDIGRIRQTIRFEHRNRTRS